MSIDINERTDAMNFRKMLCFICITLTTSAVAQTYKIESGHTYPSFEADHMGISFWRGKFTRTSGTFAIDRAAKTGSFDITIDAGSIDFGHAKMSEHAKSPDMFNAQKFPVITYKGNVIEFNGDMPVAITGDMSMLGVTKLLTLRITKFKCIQHPMMKREVCGADATGELNRSDFGIGYGVPGSGPEVKLFIQMEALKTD